ncbi:MAG: DUF2470 domain-containing protein [Pseudomonadota bacterium]
MTSVSKRGDESTGGSAETSVLRPVTDEVRAAAKALVRTSRHAALALIDAGSGAPAVSRIGLATDTDGQPIFPVSALSGRSEEMAADGRASLLLGDPGKGDPLAHPRITLDGRLHQLREDDRARARRRYLARHPKAKIYIDFADFSLWKLKIEAASYIGGFGQAYRMSADDVVTVFDDWPAWNAMEGGAVEHMNDDHSDATELYATRLCKASEGPWRITGLDPEGIDMANGDDHLRYAYDTPLGSSGDIRPKLVELVKLARSRV